MIFNIWLGGINQEREVEFHNFIKKVKPWICALNEAERIYCEDIRDNRDFLKAGFQ